MAGVAAQHSLSILAFGVAGERGAGEKLEGGWTFAHHPAPLAIRSLFSFPSNIVRKVQTVLDARYNCGIDLVG